MKKATTFFVMFICVMNLFGQNFQTSEIIIHNRHAQTQEKLQNLQWYAEIGETYVNLTTSDNVCLPFKFPDAWEPIDNSVNNWISFPDNGCMEITWNRASNLLILKFPDRIWELHLIPDVRHHGEVYRQLKNKNQRQ